jgi:hypothetical protein
MNLQENIQRIKSIMGIITESKTMWTKETAREEIKKYSKKTEIKQKNPSLYSTIFRHGWSDIFPESYNSQISWTEEMIRKEASKYKTKNDFVKGSRKAADRAKYYGIWDEITKDYEVLGNLHKRLVYVYEFPDNTAYVGLTFSKEKRDKRHKIEGPVAKHIKKTGLYPTLKIVSDDYIDVKDAQNLEFCTIDKYKKEGWNILNTAKAGGLGSCIITYTLDYVRELTQKYTVLKDFRDNEKSAYDACVRNGWLGEVTKHMQKRTTDWTKEMIQGLADKYETLKDFMDNHIDAYSYALTHGWIGDITKKLERKWEKKWNKETLDNEMSKYVSLNQFRTNSPSAYVVANRLLGSQYINDFYGSKMKVNWTDEKLKQEASKYDNRVDFKLGSPTAYSNASRNGKLDDITQHMPEERIKWTKERAAEEVLKYDSLLDIRTNNKKLYKAILKYEWHDIIPDPYRV